MTTKVKVRSFQTSVKFSNLWLRYHIKTNTGNDFEHRIMKPNMCEMLRPGFFDHVNVQWPNISKN